MNFQFRGLGEYPGTRENFVFSLAPEMAVYSSTGFNDHYQYLNIQQQTFPNGMVNWLKLKFLYLLLIDCSRDLEANWITSPFGSTRNMVEVFLFISEETPKF